MGTPPTPPPAAQDGAGPGAFLEEAVLLPAVPQVTVVAPDGVGAPSRGWVRLDSLLLDLCPPPAQPPATEQAAWPPAGRERAPRLHGERWPCPGRKLAALERPGDEQGKPFDRVVCGQQAGHVPPRRGLSWSTARPHTGPTQAEALPPVGRWGVGTAAPGRHWLLGVKGVLAGRGGSPGAGEQRGAVPGLHVAFP